MTDQELKDLVASLAVDSKELHAAQKETSEQIKRNDQALTEKLDRMGITLGNMGQNQGADAEEFFYNSLKETQTLAGVHYDFIDKNILRSGNGVSDELKQQAFDHNVIVLQRKGNLVESYLPKSEVH